MRYLKSILLFLAIWPLLVFGQSAINKPEFIIKDETLLIDLTAQINLPVAVIDAVDNGIELIFAYQFEIYSGKWYKPLAIAKLKKEYWLSYNRTTDEYTLKDPITYQNHNFKELRAVKTYLSRLTGFPLLLFSQLPKNAHVKLRFELSAKNLPAFTKVERLFSKKWQVNSPWYDWLIEVN